MAKKTLLISAGVISTILGVSFIIPSVLKEMLVLSVFSALFVVAGIVLLAFGFGD